MRVLDPHDGGGGGGGTALQMFPTHFPPFTPAPFTKFELKYPAGFGTPADDTQ